MHISHFSYSVDVIFKYPLSLSWSIDYKLYKYFLWGLKIHWHKFRPEFHKQCNVKILANRVLTLTRNLKLVDIVRQLRRDLWGKAISLRHEHGNDWKTNHCKDRAPPTQVNMATFFSFVISRQCKELIDWGEKSRVN